MNENLLFRRLSRAKRLIVDRRYRLEIAMAFGFFDRLDDESFIKKQYYAVTGRTLDLSNPHSFNEKIQWLKLYDRNPDYIIMSDKVLAKDYVAKRIGKEHIVSTLGVWDSPKDIVFDDLPNKFVLKCNHNSGLGMCICKDKTQLNYDLVRRDLRKGLNEDHYKGCREWYYHEIPRKIIAEEYLEDTNVFKLKNELASDGLIDYKFYCFNGEPKFLYVGYANINNGIKRDVLSFLTLDWKPAPFRRNDHDPIPWIPDKPDRFDDMVNYSRILSENIPFVRIDFYCINENVLFSEFTFSPGGGYGLFDPYEWEEQLGDWLVLPSYR